MKTADIQIRDPFVLTVPDEGCYYLFGSTDPDIWSGPGTGFDCYRGSDLEQWSGPVPAFRPPAGFWSPGRYWAPEVHRYDGRWFMLATFADDDQRRRGTQVLAADRPEGPYLPWSDGPVTPQDWLSLDGTLLVEDGRPWLVFCHEWLQVEDGEMCAVPLTSDLRTADGDPVLLFRASEAAWVQPIGDDPARPGYVTDGPYLHRTDGGDLLMLWSSFGTRGYAMGLARSASGSVLGPWEQQHEPLWAEDGGHGMLFRDLHGALHITLHTPNDTPNERAVFVPVVEDRGTLQIDTATRERELL